MLSVGAPWTMMDASHMPCHSHTHTHTHTHTHIPDLSLIAGENRVTFDTDFSLSDIMNSDPLLGLDPGIT